MPTIVTLIERPEEHSGEIAALFEIFSGQQNGPQRAAYLRQREEALQAVLQQVDRWNVHQEQARAYRIDGMIVAQWFHNSIQGWAWCLTLPAEGHCTPGRRWLEAHDLPSAVLEVDQLFPLAPWWPALDRAARPWMYDGSPGGAKPT